MRAAFALLLALAVPVAAQDNTFTDADFGFTLRLPAGLTPVDAAHLAAALGSAEAAKNVPRSEAGGKPISHHYAWIDGGSPYNRQVAIDLYDGAPPWKPDDFPEAMSKQGTTVESHEALKAPVSGWRIEGTFAREPDKQLLRKTVLYLPDLFGKHYGLVTLQSNATDWSIVKDDFLVTLNSTRMQRAPPPKDVADALKAQAAKGEKSEAAPGAGAAPHPGKPGQAKPGGAPKGKGGGAKGGEGHAAAPAAAPAAPPETSDWGSLPVVGSFVLAAAVLAHLLLSGRAPR